MKVWRRARIGEVCDLMTGGTPSRTKAEYYDRGTIPWLVSGDIHRGEIHGCDGRITELGLKDSNARWLPVNSVIIALNGQGKTRGTVALLRVNATCNQSLISVSPKNPSDLLPEFLFWNLRGRYEWIRRITGDDGNERRGLNMQLIRNIEIPLPPLEEQQRIVDLLDQAFAAVAASTTNAEKSLANALELSDSYVECAFASNRDWPEASLKDVCEVITDGTHQTPTYFGSGFVFLSSRNVTSKRIDWSNIKYIDQAQHDAMQRRVSPRVGDILLAKNGTTGVAAMVDRDVPFDIYVSLALLRPKAVILGEFLLNFVNSRAAKQQFNSRLKGTGVPNLHLKEIREVRLKYPPSMDQQRRFCEELKDFSFLAERLQDAHRAKLNELAALKQSLLDRAFTGELTHHERELVPA